MKLEIWEAAVGGKCPRILDSVAREARLRAALAAAQMGVWDRDALTGEAAAGSFGGTYEAFVASVHPDDRERLPQQVQRQIEEGAGIWVQYRAVWPDGTVHWIASRAELECDEAGTPRKLPGAAMDITGRKSAGHARQRSEANYRNLVQISRDRIWRVRRQPAKMRGGGDAAERGTLSRGAGDGPGRGDLRRPAGRVNPAELIERRKSGKEFRI
jgi:hypothetical protein